MLKARSLAALLATAQPLAAEVVIKAGHGTTSERPTHLALLGAQVQVQSITASRAWSVPKNRVACADTAPTADPP